MDALETAPRRRSREFALAAALLAVALVVGILLATRSSRPPARPASGDVVLSGPVEVGAAGVSRRLRVAEPCALEVAVDVPAGTRAKVALGPPQPAETSVVDEPDPASAFRWVVSPGDPPTTREILVPGHYVLRVTGEGDRPPPTVGLVVRMRPLAPQK